MVYFAEYASPLGPLLLLSDGEELKKQRIAGPMSA